MSLNQINKQIKIDINEASGISSKCKQKIVVLVEKYFLVDLPHDNYLNIDIEVLKDGNIKMRDIEYETKNPVKKEEELEKRFQLFQEEVDILLQKNEINFETISVKKDRNNLIWVILITIAIIIIALNAIRVLLNGDLFGVLWLVLIIGYYIIPATGNSIRNRYIQAYRYLKRFIYKNKK